MLIRPLFMYFCFKYALILCSTYVRASGIKGTVYKGGFRRQVTLKETSKLVYLTSHIPDYTEH